MNTSLTMQKQSELAFMYLALHALNRHFVTPLPIPTREDAEAMSLIQVVALRREADEQLRAFEGFGVETSDVGAEIPVPLLPLRCAGATKNEEFWPC